MKSTNQLDQPRARLDGVQDEFVPTRTITASITGGCRIPTIVRGGGGGDSGVQYHLQRIAQALVVIVVGLAGVGKTCAQLQLGDYETAMCRLMCTAQIVITLDDSEKLQKCPTRERTKPNNPALNV